MRAVDVAPLGLHGHHPEALAPQGLKLILAQYGNVDRTVHQQGRYGHDDDRQNREDADKDLVFEVYGHGYFATGA